MLVITRKSSESFTIGDNVKVNILDINGEKVKIGIEAPKDIVIMRSEVLETIRNNIEAVSASRLPNLDLLKQKIILKRKSSGPKK